MAQQLESSVTISLKELMNLEDRRRAEAIEQARARAEAEERRIAGAAAARAAEEDEARARAEERARVEALRAAMDEAHIEAAKLAHVERARLETQLALRAEELAARDAHARELAARLAESRGPRPIAAVALSVLAAVTLVIAIAVSAFAAQKRSAPVAAPAVTATAAAADPSLEEIERLRAEIAALRANTPKLDDAPKPPVFVPTKPKALPAPKPVSKIDCAKYPMVPMCGHINN